MQLCAWFLLLQNLKSTNNSNNNISIWLGLKITCSFLKEKKCEKDLFHAMLNIIQFAKSQRGGFVTWQHSGSKPLGHGALTSVQAKNHCSHGRNLSTEPPPSPSVRCHRSVRIQNDTWRAADSDHHLPISIYHPSNNIMGPSYSSRVTANADVRANQMILEECARATATRTYNQSSAWTPPICLLELMLSKQPLKS